MREVTIFVRVGTPEHEAVVKWLNRWGWTLQQFRLDEGCGCCVKIYNVTALPDVLADLPPDVIISDAKRLGDLVRMYCRCLVPNLSKTEQLQLDNVIDTHNSLWDGDLSVAEGWAMFSAIAEALRSTPHFGAFVPALAELERLLHSDLPATEIWDRARCCTYDLRLYAARLLEWADKGLIPITESISEPLNPMKTTD